MIYRENKNKVINNEKGRYNENKEIHKENEIQNKEKQRNTQQKIIKSKVHVIHKR